jgi:phenylalanyl-tRNA synthetase beta chain
MRIVLSWLREFVDVDLPVEDLGALLSLRGMHLEAIEHPWAGLEGVIVARVVEVRDHPNSDRLCLARVQTGSGEQEVVVGVRNMAEGDLVPLAGPGARVPALPEPLSAREIRGVVSNGMLCSPSELALSGDHSGILVLEENKLPVGADLKQALGLEDVVLDLEIESNRPDLLSVVGVAREVAGAVASELRLPDSSVVEAEDAAEEAASVRIYAPDGCPRYLARVIRGVTMAPSPIRAQARLFAAGVRPLNNVVDATNYVMLETGQPLHAFDMRRLVGPGIEVRRARVGERLTTLDDVERSLEPEDLLICDLENPVAIAGVMGGETSEVSEDTRDVLLESAFFEPRGILRTSRRLLLPTEAAIRFSRGTDPEAVAPAASRAASLISAWARGEVLKGAIDVGDSPSRRHVSMRTERASLLAGHEVGPNEAVAALESIGIPARAADQQVVAEIPGHRPDLQLEVDLVEEIIRVEGYDRVGSTVPRISQAGGVADSYELRDRVRDLLVRAGLREALSLSFARPSDLELMGVSSGVLVANPPSADEPYLRASLVPGLLRAIARNSDRGARGAMLFEVGRVFAPGDPVDETEHVAACLWGTTAGGFQEPPRTLEVLDAKGALETLLMGLGIDDWTLGGPPGPPMHPGRSAQVLVGESTVGLLGEIHPATVASLDIDGRVAIFELDLAPIVPEVTRSRSFRAVPRFPPVRRDLAFVVPEGIPVGQVQEAIREAAGEFIDRLELFDVFRGASIPEGTKSLAFSLDLRAPDRTLSGDDADEAVRAITSVLASRFGATLRA